MPVIAASRMAGGAAQQAGERGQCAQEPGVDRVELADMTEGEHPQERAQRRRGVRPGEHPSHPTMSQHVHVIDGICAGDHPADQGGDLQPRVGALVRRHAQVLIGQIAQAGGLGQCKHRDQTTRRHEIRIVERHRRSTKTVRESHPRGALPGCC